MFTFKCVLDRWNKWLAFSFYLGFYVYHHTFLPILRLNLYRNVMSYILKHLTLKSLTHLSGNSCNFITGEKHARTSHLFSVLFCILLIWTITHQFTIWTISIFHFHYHFHKENGKITKTTKFLSKKQSNFIVKTIWWKCFCPLGCYILFLRILSFSLNYLVIKFPFNLFIGTHFTWFHLFYLFKISYTTNFYFFKYHFL